MSSPYLLVLPLLLALCSITKASDKQLTREEGVLLVENILEESLNIPYDEPDSAIIVARQALELSREFSYPLGEAKSAIKAGRGFLGIQALDSAKFYIALGEKIAIGIPSPIVTSTAFIQWGYYYKKVDSLGKSLSYFLENLKIKERIGSDEDKASAYLLVGIAYRDLEDYDLARKYLESSIQMREKIGEPTGIARSYLSMGNFYGMIGKPNTAMEYYEKTLEVAMEFNDLELIENSWNNMGIVLMDLEKYEEAIDAIWNSLEIRKRLNNEIVVADGLYNLARVYKAKNDCKTALDYLNQSLEIHLKPNGSLEMQIWIFQNLIECEVKLGNYNKAFSDHETLIDLKDSLFNDQLTSSIAKMTAVYESEKTVLELENSIAKEERATFQRNVLIGGSLLLVLLGAFLFRAYYSKKKTNEKLSHALDNLTSAQNKLVHAEKMASLGQITAGIAHEIQNPLNFVNNFAELSVELSDDLLEELKEGRGKVLGDDSFFSIEGLLDDIRSNSDKIHHHGNRADSIVKNMLLHSRTSTSEKSPVDLNVLIEEYIALAYHGMRGKNPDFNCSIKKELDESIGKVNLVQQDMGRALLNIMNNAFQAMNEKRKKLGDEYKAELAITSQIKPDGKVYVIIRDNGPGIPDSLMEKIFLPFFTTKPTGVGTGLGLSMSYDMIVKSNNGTLEVNSVVNDHTEFIIGLPA